MVWYHVDYKELATKEDEAMTSCKDCGNYWHKPSRTGRHFRHFCRIKQDYMGERGIASIWVLCPFKDMSTIQPDPLEADDPFTKAVKSDAEAIEKKIRDMMKEG